MNRIVIALITGFCFAHVAAGAQFKFESQTFTVPDGFELERVAGPPLIDRPIAMDFDEQGRLYVSDSSGSNEKVEKQLQDKPHRIVRLEDTDGDGRFDKRTVFADQMMFPEGVMWLEGSLYVGAPPSIWRLTDTDDDGVAERREEWHQGKTLTGCANDMHGPYRGPDGWIYWCKGASAEQTYDLGAGKTFKSRASHIFRKRPDGSGLEVVMTGGMDNPVDVAFSSAGERFFTTTFVQQPEAGKRDGLVHAIYGGVYGKVSSSVDGHKRTGELMPVMMLWGPAAPCGLTSYESTFFGPDFRDNLFACLFNLHKVTRHELKADGATFRNKTSDFLTSDSPDFHPTDVVEDADGSLLVIDTGGWYKLCCPTSQLAKPDVLGAIYRVRRKGAPPVKDPRGLSLAWDSLKPSGLVQLLSDPRPAVRERARQALGKAGDAAVSALSRPLSRKESSVESLQNVVWALSRIDSAKARHATLAALANSAEPVRLTGAHAVSVWRDPAALPALTSLLKDPSAAVRRAAAEGIGRIGNPSAAGALLAAAEGAGADRALEHSLIYALIEIGNAAAVAPGLASSKPAGQRAALVALDQIEGSGLKAEQLTALLVSSEPLLKQTAWWIVGHRTEWGDALAGFFRTQLELFKESRSGSAPASGLSRQERDELTRQLGQLARSPAVGALLLATVRDGSMPVEARVAALRAMGQAGLKETPAEWLAAVAGVLASDQEPLWRQAVATARQLPMPKGGHPDLANALVRVARQPGLAAETRLDALAAVPGGLSAVEPELFSFLQSHLEPEHPVNVRGAAATVLARAKLAPDQLLALVDSLKTVGPLEMAKLLAAFEKRGDETLGTKLVSTLKASKRAGLREDLVKPLLTNYPPVVRKQGEELLALLNADAGKQKAHLEKLLKDCKGGDVRRGQAIFNSTKAACAACHAIGYLGGRVGPDLTSIGQVRTDRDLLEAIVFPSASFVRSYEPLIVATRSGEEFSGVLRKDAADEIVLATGPETEARIARADIAEMRPGGVSVMPQGLDEQLSRQELADLLAFLKNTKWGPQ